MTEIELIEKAAIKVGMMSLLNHGAASCVFTEGCNGVSQEHLVAFAREVALHCAIALGAPAGAGEGERKPVAFRLKHDKLGGGWRYFEGELGREPADGEQHELLFTSAPPSHEGEDARDAALTKVREHFDRNGDLLFWGSAVVSWIDAIDAALRERLAKEGRWS